MNNEYTGEFDDEFLTDILGMGPSKPPDNSPLLTVATEAAHNALILKTQQEIQQERQEQASKKRKTYLSSEIPVRPCTKDCPKRQTCADFRKGRVADRDLCKPELRQIKKWQAAFRKGEVDKIKDDAGAVAGALAIQVYRLIEQAILDGVVVETLKTNAYGNYLEKMAHPALQQAANICKTLGINLNDFLMTPKSNKDAGPQFQVNVGVSFNDVQNRFAARYGQVTQIE